MTNKSFQIINHNIHFNWDKISADLLNVLGQILICSLVFWLILRGGSFLINRYLSGRRKKFNARTRTIANLVVNIFQYTVIFFYLSAILSILGIPVGTLIAGAGIFSLAIGMGAQGFISDLVNGFFILAEDQFDVGDIVQLSNNIGTVTQLGLRTTKLQATDGTIIFIPNRNIAIVQNLTQGGLGLDIDLKLALNNDLNKVLTLIKQVNQATNAQQYLLGKPQIVGLIAQEGTSCTYRIHFQVKVGKKDTVRNLFFKNYLQKLKAADVKFAD